MQFFLNGFQATLSDYADDPLVRSVINSLFCWRRADASDDRPCDSWMGWWGDSYADEDGDQWGSKLWLLFRSKTTPDVLKLAEQYAKDALQWMIDDGIASRVETHAEAGGMDQLNIQVTVYKPDGTVASSLRFQDIWSGIDAI